MKNKLLWLHKITRPVGFLAAGLGTWVVALVSNGPDIASANKIAAAVSMGLSCLAASIYHYGAAHYMYQRKWYDPVEIKQPRLLVTCGVIIFSLSITIAWMYLPANCVGIAVFNAVAISFYARIFSKTWLTKNLIIACVCTTPIVLGWWAGSHTPAILPFACGIVFFAHLAREIIKDVQDIRANHGVRITLPIKFGITGAMRLAGGSITTSAYFASLLLYQNRTSPAVAGLIATAVCVFVWVAMTLFLKPTPGRTQKWITVGVYSLILSVMVTGLQH